MTRKYAGIDFHSSSTSQIAIRDEEGSLFTEPPMTVKTQPEPLLTAIKAVPGELEVIVEASTGSGWLKELIEPHVERFVVCHAADNNRVRGNKTDKSDARDLSKRLWLGEFTEVYQGSAVRDDLRLLVNHYLQVNDKVVRAKNQLKGLFRERNIHCKGDDIYKTERRQYWLDKLDSSVRLNHAKCLYKQLDVLNDQKDETEGEMIAEAKNKNGWDSVSSLPGFGDIRTSQILGIIGTPFRFPGKAQLVRYSRLAVVVHDSRQWVSNGPDGPRRHHEQVTRGLNKDGRPELKHIFKGAAEDAIKHYPEVQHDFNARLKKKSPEKAKLDIARKLVSQLLTVWKRQEVYDPKKAKWLNFSSED